MKAKKIKHCPICKKTRSEIKEYLTDIEFALFKKGARLSKQTEQSILNKARENCLNENCHCNPTCSYCKLLLPYLERTYLQEIAA